MDMRFLGDGMIWLVDWSDIEENIEADCLKRERVFRLWKTLFYFLVDHIKTRKPANVCQIVPRLFLYNL
ncbi:hypothetical protein PPOLYM_04113 [Paenibacillus polymyxa]|nr:hypothetical protein PPOLYM_04113 [Paenibacillus polymyxa]